VSRPSDSEIRRHAHRLAAEALTAALGMWDLHRHYPDVDDRDRLECELLAIIDRHREQGGEDAASRLTCTNPPTPG
jgi:hypothetical protein